MITSLLVLNSSYVGSRDLWWTEDPKAEKGYNIYRAFDYPTNWTKLNAQPHLGHFYRDMSALQLVTYTVQDTDWVERGELGRWGFRIPDIPYSDIVQGRPVTTNSSDEVTVILDGQPYRPVAIQAFDKTVWLQMDNTLGAGGAVYATPLKSDGVVWQADYSGVQSFQAQYKKLLNYVDIYTTLIRTFYTVVPIGENGAELHVPGAPHTQVKNSQEID